MQAWKGILLGALIAVVLYFLVVGRKKSDNEVTAPQPASTKTAARRQNGPVIPRSPLLKPYQPPAPGTVADPSIEGPQGVTAEQAQKYLDIPGMKGVVPFVPHPNMKAPVASDFDSMKAPYDPEKNKDRFLMPSQGEAVSKMIQIQK